MDHDWEKVTGTPVQDGNGIYDLYRCIRCGVEYRRTGMAWTPDAGECSEPEETEPEGALVPRSDTEYQRCVQELQTANLRTEVKAKRLILFLKWRWGVILLRYPKLRTDQTIRQIAADIGRPNSYADLYLCIKLAREYPSPGAVKKLYNALYTQRGFPPSWRFVCDQKLRGRESDALRRAVEMDRQEERLERIESTLARVDEELEGIQQKAAEGGITEQADSLRTKLIEVKETLHQVGEMTPKDVSEEARANRAKLYHDWIRKNEACCICGDDNLEIAHFPRSRGAGGSDFDVLPLCREHHQEMHDDGVDTFLVGHLEEVYQCLCSILPIRIGILEA